jgi:uncharacterized protein YndB with AHSA1/START domain
MPKIDATNGSIIDSLPTEVYEAILNEYAGVTNWWMPDVESKLRGEIPIDREGAIVDITLHLGKRITSKMTATMTKIVEAKSIEYNVAGDIIGTGTWTFEPTDGKTKIQYHLKGKTNRLLATLASPFVNIEKGHSEMMQRGFNALNTHLKK